MRNLVAVLPLLLAAACGTSDTTEPVAPAAPALLTGTYCLTSVNGRGLPFTDTETGVVWTKGQWVVTPDNKFTATIDAAAGNIPKRLTRTGVVEPLDGNSLTIVYSDSTRSLAVRTAAGFRAGLGWLTLGFARKGAEGGDAGSGLP